MSLSTARTGHGRLLGKGGRALTVNATTTPNAASARKASIASIASGLLASILVLVGAEVYAAQAPFAPEPETKDPNAVTWLVAGPFAWGERRPFTDPLDVEYLPGGEGPARPAPVQSAETQAWLPFDTSTGAIDFSDEFGSRGLALAYAFREFRSPTAKTVLLSAEFRSQAKVWLNGELVLVRRSALAKAIVERHVRLNEGVNRLLVKSLATGSGWAFAFAIDDVEEGSELRGEAKADEFHLLDRVAQRGGSLRGFLIPAAAASARTGGDALAERGRPRTPAENTFAIVARDEGGAILATASADSEGDFELRLPGTFSGPCFVGIEGDAGSMAASRVAALAGDYASLAAARAAEARSLSRSLDPSIDEGAARIEGWMDAGASLPRLAAAEDYARAARLLYLASRVAGGGRPEPAGFEADVRALAELGAALVPRARAPGESAVYGNLESRAYRLSRGGLSSYLLRLPEDYEMHRPCGLVLCVPGEEEGREAAERIAAAKPRGFVIAAPGRGAGPAGPAPAAVSRAAMEPPSENRPAEPEIEALELAELLDVIVGRHSIDLDRIFLVGWGSGGAAALNAAAFLADRLAGVVSFSGLPDPRLTSGLAGLDVVIARGTDDERITREGTSAAAARIEDAGGRPRVVAAQGGSAWRAARTGEASADGDGWGAAELLEVLGTMSRSSWPLRVSRMAGDPALGRAHWLRLVQAIEGSKPMEASASVLDARHLEVATANLAVFELDLGHPSLARTGRVVVAVDGRELAVDAGTVARFTKSGNAFTAP